MTGSNLPYKKIGLFGGSFNPAHEGHLLLSLTALRHLHLDEVWWIITHNNPLKENTLFLSPKEKKTEITALISPHQTKIKILFQKNITESPYTIDLIEKIYLQNPQDKFIWLMGADTLPQLPKWHKWKKLITLIPFFIFSRPSHHKKALSSQFAKQFHRYKVPESKHPFLIHYGPKYWGFDETLHCPLSSTKHRHLTIKNKIK